MKRLSLTFMIVLLTTFYMASSSFAGCWVQDGTFYSKSKSSMTAFAIYMDQEKRADALRMVDDGRIASCSQASCTVIERADGVVNVNIMGIGKIWIYKTFLHCR